MTNLENVSADDLRETLAKVDDGDAVKRLTAAITFKETDELSQKGAAELYGFSSSWPSKWFQRLERLEEEPFEELVSGEPRDGRSRELTQQEHEQFIDPPEKSGIDAPAWSVPLARYSLREEFDVEYCERHVRRVDVRGRSVLEDSPAGIRQVRRACAGSLARRVQKKRNSLDDEYIILTIDQTRQVLSTLIYAWFPEGERPSLPVTGKWDSIKLLGAVSDAGETFFVPCEENFNSDTTI